MNQPNVAPLEAPPVNERVSATPPGDQRSSGKSPLMAAARNLLVRHGMVLVLLLLVVVSAILYPGFLSPGNLNNLLDQVAPVGIVAVGMTYVIIARGFDLSVAAIFAGAAVFYASFSNSMPLWVAFVATVLLAVVCGLCNGFVITFIKVNPLIATLATASLISGVTYLYSNSTPVVSENPGFSALGTGQWGGIWISIYLLAALVLVAGIILARTPYGRSLYAVGGNEEAARLAGMRVRWIKISTFVITGVCAAVAGMLIASKTGVGQANIGSTVALDAIAIVIIGGTSLLGGEGSVWRTVTGILIWGTVTNLLSSLALDTSAQLLMTGGIFLIAVSIDSLARRGRSSA
ncbi:ABC transporter permease [Gordonia sp. LSe1-13]|uniref:Autoinducer 2 import system permease protein LsrD n=1 Tax=Gordonia sesuvii TaxID=3116777 RepID=A0ABU7MIS6_9ACTN|nr:ABC transporter permease [Gordonia sp. LSe1-13]